jgi:hypothetical protein
VTLYLFHFDQETINEVPRTVDIQGFLVFFYFLQNITLYISKIFKDFVMTPWEIIKDSREGIADLKNQIHTYIFIRLSVVAHSYIPRYLEG